MRELHSFSDKRLAGRLSAVLRSQDMATTVEQEGEFWVVWIQNDDDRDKAREVLGQFQANPESQQFAAAEKIAKELEAVAEKANRERTRLHVDIRDRWKGLWWKCHPVSTILIAISVAITAAGTDWKALETNGGIFPRTCNDETSVIRNAMFIQAPEAVVSIFGYDQAFFGKPHLMQTLKSGQIWRPITPIFLHFDVLHILFNMMWMRNLGMGIEFLRGSRRYLFLVLLIAVISNVTQLYWSGPAFGGMSGVVFGLIGYAWIKGRTQPHLGIGLMPNQVVFSMVFLLLCIGGAFGSIANAAHVSGLVAGMIIAGRQALWKKAVNLLQGPSR